MATFVNGVEQAAAGAGGATTREGGQTTEATTTSTSATDAISATSLTVAAAEPFQIVIAGRKTSGAADHVGTGWKQNTTVIEEAVGGSATPWRSSSTDRAEDGGATVFVRGRATNYLHSAEGVYSANITADHANVAYYFTNNMGTAAAALNVEMTSLIIRGITDNSSNTLGLDELQVHSFSSS